jgi:DNA-binding transcriptional MerR regulator
MPYKEPKIEKLYYSIGEVADKFKVNTSLIRFWEKEFDIIKPHKNKKGNRLFTPQDVDNFHLIFHLVKEKGMTLKGAKLKLKENKEDTVNNFEVVSRLKEIRSLLVEVRDNIGV